MIKSWLASLKPSFNACALPAFCFKSTRVNQLYLVIKLWIILAVLSFEPSLITITCTSPGYFWYAILFKVSSIHDSSLYAAISIVMPGYESKGFLRGLLMWFR